MCFFEQVGCFDPYSDDPRLGIQKISLCKYSNKLVVAGTAGQVKVYTQSYKQQNTCIASYSIHGLLYI